MCGVLGFVALGPTASLPRLEAALNTLKHRGPDARGIQKIDAPGATCLLGHTRLRIIDLCPEADQPMPNEDETVWVSYNGEIYNHRELRTSLEGAGHRFRSKSDSEVLVHLYEEEGDEPSRMFKRLRGMFGFAIFDAQRGHLLLGRDRLGIKPMYWAEAPGGLLFSSEVRALVHSGLISCEPDRSALAECIVRGAIRAPHTWALGVHELPPGCYLQWEGGRQRLARWWRADVVPDPELSGDARRLLQAALGDAVQRHLVADRPVGVFLSSGVDSGVVAALAAGQGAVRALTVTFPDSDGDEGAEAAALARRVGAAHELVPVTGEDVKQGLPDILRAMDQPTTDGVNTWVVCHAARQAGLVVALSGLGGDELFGGYPTFRLVPLLGRLSSVLDLVPAPLRARAAALAGRRSPGAPLARILAAAPGDAGAYVAVRSLFVPGELNGLGRSGAQDLPFEVEGLPAEDGATLHRLDRVSLLELRNYLPSQLLRDTDQMAMAHSLEVRVPLLDDTVVRVALALPADVRTARGKSLLAAAGGLTDGRDKRPFSLPLGHWMRGPLNETVRDGLLSEELPLARLVPGELRRRLWDAFQDGRAHWSRPWAVAVTRLWCEVNGLKAA